MVEAGIAYEDWCAGAAINATGTSNVIGSTANLKKPQLSEIWGSSNNVGGLVQLVAFWDDPRPLSIMGLLDFRFATLSNVRVRYGYLNSGGSNVYIDTAVRPPRSYPTDYFVRHDLLTLATPVTARGIFIDISAVSGGLGQFTIGRLWAGPLWRPPSGIKRRWRSGIIDPGVVPLSRGGQGYPHYEQRIRTLAMDLSHVPLSQTIGLPDNSILDLQQLFMRIGTTSPVIATPRLDDQGLHRLGIYSHCTDGLQIEHAGGDYYTASARFRELL